MFVCLEAGVAAAAVGFLLGSMPDRNYRMTESTFNMVGAVFWSLVAGAIVAGCFYQFTGGKTFDGWVVVALGVALALTRIIATSPPRTRTYLDEGINRMEGKTVKSKFSAAIRVYNTANFRRTNTNYHATRSTVSFRYGKRGMPVKDLRELKDFLTPRNWCDIVVLLLRDLPGEPETPAVLVVCGGKNLRALIISDEAVNIPSVAIIPSSSIAGAVCYRW